MKRRFSMSSSALRFAEDGLGDTVKPRLEAAGADCGRVFAIRAVTTIVEGTKERKAFNLSQDIESLRAEIQRHPRCRLVIIDTINSYLGRRSNSDKDNEVRQILLPLTDLAEQTGVAVLAVSHLNKSGNGRAINRIMGSLAFVGVARVAWMLGTAEEDKERRLLAPIKCNIARMPQARAFKIEEGPRLAWEIAGLDVTADDMLSRGDEQQGDRKTDEVKRWIRERLKDGPVWSTVMIDEAKERRYSKWTTDKACEELGVVRGRPVGQFGGKHCWAIPPYVIDGKVSQTPVESGDSLSADRPYYTDKDHPTREPTSGDQILGKGWSKSVSTAERAQREGPYSTAGHVEDSL
jgi:hypothetical protein